jgi:hypothetical protein
LLQPGFIWHGKSSGHCFLGAFAKQLPQATVRLVMPVLSDVSRLPRDTHWADFREILYFGFFLLKIISRDIPRVVKIWQNYDSLHHDLRLCKPL